MNQQSKKQKIKIADNIPGAEYANIVQISHNKEEFQMMFASIMGQSGKVVGKIITNPGHFKRIVKAMDENLKKYEDQHGKIEEAEAPKGMGFQDRK